MEVTTILFALNVELKLPVVAPLNAPDTFPVPSKLCPQIVLTAWSLVADATLSVKNAKLPQALVSFNASFVNIL